MTAVLNRILRSYPAGYITFPMLSIRTDEDAVLGDILSHKIMAVGTCSGGVLMEDFYGTVPRKQTK